MKTGVIGSLVAQGMVEAGGVGISRLIEKTQLIHFSKRQKRKKRGNCAQLERIWNTAFLS